MLMADWWIRRASRIAGMRQANTKPAAELAAGKAVGRAHQKVTPP
jgi:hypothetical protein